MGSAGRVYRAVWRGSAVHTHIGLGAGTGHQRPASRTPASAVAARTPSSEDTIATHDARVPVLGEDELPLRLRVPGGPATAPPQHTAHLPGSSGFRSEGSSLVSVIISDKELVL